MSDRGLTHLDPLGRARMVDVTPKDGPMKGKRMQMDEAGLYTVKQGKVVQEEFFYHMG